MRFSITETPWLIPSNVQDADGAQLNITHNGKLLQGIISGDTQTGKCVVRSDYEPSPGIIHKKVDYGTKENPFIRYEYEQDFKAPLRIQPLTDAAKKRLAVALAAEAGFHGHSSS